MSQSEPATAPANAPKRTLDEIEAEDRKRAATPPTPRGILVLSGDAKMMLYDSYYIGRESRLRHDSVAPLLRKHHPGAYVRVELEKMEESSPFFDLARFLEIIDDYEPTHEGRRTVDEHWDDDLYCSPSEEAVYPHLTVFFQ